MKQAEHVAALGVHCGSALLAAGIVFLLRLLQAWRAVPLGFTSLVVLPLMSAPLRIAGPESGDWFQTLAGYIVSTAAAAEAAKSQAVAGLWKDQYGNTRMKDRLRQ